MNAKGQAWSELTRPLCLMIGCLWLGLLAAASPAIAAPCPVPPEADPGWVVSFAAGCLDRDGHRAGGSQVMHLVPHQGALYAAVGYWKDAHNAWYGGGNAATGWGQILRLSAAAAPWAVDLELGPRHLRPELLTSATFTLDASGRALPSPVALLLAAAYDGGGEAAGGITLFRRDEARGAWARSSILAGATGRKGEDNSVRAAIVHRDRVTGREHLFLSIGVVGLFRAAYDPGRAEPLVWEQTPELVPAGTRILGLAEADGMLVVSDGSRVMRRIDGAAPRYETIADFTSEMDPATPRAIYSQIGGIRGITAVSGPVAGRQSLLLAWHAGRTARACVLRLDPRPDGTWSRQREVCLADLVERRLGARVGFVLAAYNRFTPLTDGRGGMAHVAGLEAFLVGPATLPLTAHNQRTRDGGFYAGALLAVRDDGGGWRLAEVDGGFAPGRPERVSTYDLAASPFAGADSGRVYLGGYDPNNFASTDTAWIARGARHLLTGN